jgi:hypothetical protein
MRTTATLRNGGDGTMTIVTNRRPARRKRPKKPAQPAEIKVQRVVRHLSEHKREPKPRGAPDPEVEARVEAFFQRMGLKLPDGWSN